jgi:hypothetical protein
MKTLVCVAVLLAAAPAAAKPWLAVFFNEDGKTVQSLTFTPPQAAK